MRKRGTERRRKLMLCGFALIGLLGAIGCREHSAVAPVVQKTAQPAAQQPAQVRVETDLKKSCREFVQGFYDWYFVVDNNWEVSGSNEDDVLRLKPEVLDSKLLRLLKGDYAARARMNGNADLTLEADPYINSQDSAEKYLVRTATYRDGKCRATVWRNPPAAERNIPGAERDVVDPELAFEDGTWIFVNFHYPDPETPSDENLIDMLIELRKQRAREMNKGAQL